MMEFNWDVFEELANKNKLKAVEYLLDTGYCSDENSAMEMVYGAPPDDYELDCDYEDID